MRLLKSVSLWRPNFLGNRTARFEPFVMLYPLIFYMTDREKKELLWRKKIKKKKTWRAQNKHKMALRLIRTWI